MTGEIHDLSPREFFALLAGSPALQARLAAGEQFRARTPFVYPGRLGSVIVSLSPRPEPEPEPESDDQEDSIEAAAEEMVIEEAGGGERRPVKAKKIPPAPPPPDAIRITDTGGLLKFLPEHGMELEADMVMSRTVFHAVRQMEGGGIAHGQIYLDSTAGNAGKDLWRFLQMVAEIIGLRHGKYKDALVQLERRRETEQGVSKWRPS
ncbi:MAG: hypothetical protein JW990_18885 [Thermoleophilia bacterium]|nr:hypothetical protein [Thermoleophilia bacterium]